MVATRWFGRNHCRFLSNGRLLDFIGSVVVGFALAVGLADAAPSHYL